MSYYTEFELTIYEGQADLKAVKERLDEIMEMPGEQSVLTVFGDRIISIDPLPWYDHDEEVAEMSKSFPGVVFQLHGEGSLPGDLWNDYFKDGKTQICRAQIVFPEYDPQRLTSVNEAQNADRGSL